MGLFSDLIKNVNVEKGFSTGLAQGITTAVESRLAARAEAAEKEKEKLGKLAVQNAAVMKDSNFFLSDEEYMSVNGNPMSSLEAVEGNLRTNRSLVMKNDENIEAFRRVSNLPFDVTNPKSGNMYLNLYKGVHSGKYTPDSPQYAAYVKIDSFLTGQVQEIQNKRIEKKDDGGEPGDLYQMLGLREYSPEIQQAFRPMVASALGKSVNEAVEAGLVPSDMVLTYDPTDGTYNSEVVAGAGDMSDASMERIQTAVVAGNATTGYSADKKDYKFAADPLVFAGLAMQSYKKDMANMIGQGTITEKLAVDTFVGGVDLFSSGAIKSSMVPDLGFVVMSPDKVRENYFPIVRADPENGLFHASVLMANSVPIDVVKGASEKAFYESRFGKNHGQAIQAGLRENKRMLELATLAREDIREGGRTDIAGKASLFFSGVNSVFQYVTGLDTSNLKDDELEAFNSTKGKIAKLMKDMGSSDATIRRNARLQLYAYEIAYAKARLAENPEGGSVRITDLDKRAAGEAVQLEKTFLDPKAADEVLSELIQRALIDLQIYTAYAAPTSVAQLYAMRALENQFNVGDIRRDSLLQRYKFNDKTNSLQMGSRIVPGARIVEDKTKDKSVVETTVQPTRPAPANPLSNQ